MVITACSCLLVHFMVYRLQCWYNSWSVGDEQLHLSSLKSGNILVTCYYTNELIEYTTTGQLVRKIPLQQDIKNLRHAIQMGRWSVPRQSRRRFTSCLFDWQQRTSDQMLRRSSWIRTRTVVLSILFGRGCEWVLSGGWTWRVQQNHTFERWTSIREGINSSIGWIERPLPDVSGSKSEETVCCGLFK